MLSASHGEEKSEDTAVSSEERKKPSSVIPTEDISIISEESHYSSHAFISPPISETQLGQSETKPSSKPKFSSEQNDSLQSLSTNSRDYFDEETAV